MEIKKMNKKQLETYAGKLQRELVYQEDLLSDLINTVFFIVETKSKRSILTGRRNIDIEILLKELSRISLSQNVKHHSLRRIYL